MTVPSIFRNVPCQLHCVDGPVSDLEVRTATAVRKRYAMEQWQDPYMVDVIRAFRLVEGASVYIEVGTRDKGNLAWIAHKLLPGATILDVDIDRFDEAEKKLRSELSEVDYHCITGDGVAADTLAKIKNALKGRPTDAIFCDSSHLFDHALREFEPPFPLLRQGGVLMYHDCFWEGDDSHKGKAQAMQALDRFVPVYAVFMSEPVHRYLPRSNKTDVWGGISIIIRE